MASVAGLFAAFSTVTKQFFEINQVSIDDWSFKLFYKWSTTLFIISSIAVTSKQFFGDPIECDPGHAKIDSAVLEAYCWMYSTFNVPYHYKGQCSAGDYDIMDDDLLYNSYYQWVPLYLSAMAILFYLPRVVWLNLEGGLMKFFCTGTRSRIVEDQENKREKLVNYFQHHVRGRYDVYYFGFMVCELWNMVNVMTFFYLTNSFLNNRYLDFGFQVWQYHHLPAGERKLPWVKNPMCRTFPRIASCDYYRYGLGGDQERINAICVLTLNIINDKVFYVMWWWFALMLCICIFNFFNRISQCFSCGLRLALINIRLGRYIKNNPKRENIENFIKKCRLGDWFVIYQLCKNLRRPFFMELITSLSFMDEDNDVNSDVGENLISMVLRPEYVTQESEMAK